MNKSDLPFLGLTMGDPAGVGPEVLVKSLAEKEIYEYCRPLILGDLGAIEKAIKFNKLDVKIKTVAPGAELECAEGSACLLPLSELEEKSMEYGRPTFEGGKAAAIFIETGARMALSGAIKGLVTGPISKEALNNAGYNFPGHTEFLAHMAGGPEVVMMMSGSRLRVVLATIHEAYTSVPGLLTMEKIVSTAEITNRSFLHYYNMKPRIAVAALNPHAGEGGLFGDEEIRVIEPAVKEACKRGLDVSGPYPPDTLFFRAAGGDFDVVLCMYHDQGLIPFKLLHFKDGVNVTLGLPFIRTSVDHGTAFDIAGKNLADHASMVAALRTAAEMAEGAQKAESAGK